MQALRQVRVWNGYIQGREESCKWQAGFTLPAGPVTIAGNEASPGHHEQSKPGLLPPAHGGAGRAAWIARDSTGCEGASARSAGAAGIAENGGRLRRDDSSAQIARSDGRSAAGPAGSPRVLRCGRCRDVLQWAGRSVRAMADVAAISGHGEECEHGYRR